MIANVKTSVIYVPLLDEGTKVIRPTMGELIIGNVFRVLPTPDYDSEIETWMFVPGTIVECLVENWQGNQVLVAQREYDKNGR